MNNYVIGHDMLYIKKIKNLYLCYSMIYNSKIIFITEKIKNIINKLHIDNNIDNFSEEEKNIIRKLVNYKILNINDDELKKVKRIINQGKNEFALWVNLTDNCNLNCPYCDFGSKTKIFDIIKFEKDLNKLYHYVKKKGMQGINLRLSGGEPFLELNLIKKIIDLTYKIDKDFFTFLIITNGTILNDRILKLLTFNKINLAISLDGTRNVHNKTRCFKNKKPSFDIINKNIKKLIKNNIRLQILTVVSESNANNLIELFKLLYKKKLFFRYNIVRKVYNNKVELEKDNKLFIKSFEKLFLYIKQHLPKKSLIKFFQLCNINLEYKNPYHCGILKMFLGRHNNNIIYPCIEGMQKGFEVKFKDNEFVISNKNITFSDMDVNKFETCKSCNWRYICKGDCPVNKYKNFENFQLPSVRCEFYKKILPQYIDLIGFQLYKRFRKKILF